MYEGGENMPSLKQINDKNLTKQPSKEGGSGFRILFFLLLIAGAAGFAWFKYHDKMNVYTIPNKVYSSRVNSTFNRVVNATKKQIFWVSTDSQASEQQRRNILYSLKYEKLNKMYDVQFFAHETFFMKCPGEDCLEGYIGSLCDDAICIYIPSKRQIIKTDQEHLYEELHKYKDL